MTGRQTLHFLTCGHVDDGKSTLIGRLLYDIGAVPEDQARGAMINGALDFSRLTDGLDDERAQGITIDAAYRYFRHQGRHYRIADTPGHVQYTRNMAVAAANSDCALILIDAAHGIREQTLRHARIAAFFGIRDFVIAVNKMDAVGYAQARFEDLESACRAAFGPSFKNARLTFIPVSALLGDNVIGKSLNMPWYSGPALMEHLSALLVEPVFENGMRLPIQSAIRIGQARGYQGVLSGGAIAVGDRIAVAANDALINVTALYHSGREVDRAAPGSAVTFVTDSDLDLSRGSVAYGPAAPMSCTESFSARMLWLDPAMERFESVQCLIKTHAREEQAEIRLSGAAAQDTVNESGPVVDVVVHCAAPVPIDLYFRHRQTGLFLAIDPETEKVLGVGTVTDLSVRSSGLRRREASV